MAIVVGSVHMSVCLSPPAATHRCYRFAAVGPVSRRQLQWQSNAVSATLSADVGSRPHRLVEKLPLLLSTCRRGTLSSAASGSRNSSTAREVNSQRAERSDVVSSGADVGRRQASSVVELGNMHLRDLLSQDDDDDDENDVSGESPQQPQSTSCDDPPDSSTGSARGGSKTTSILKQLLSDSDTEEHNEASVCEPETTHTDKQSHVLLKVCPQTTHSDKQSHVLLEVCPQTTHSDKQSHVLLKVCPQITHTLTNSLKVCPQ